jgi:hypothetical protein
MINAVSSSANPVPAATPHFPPSTADRLPLIDPTDPPRNTNQNPIQTLMNPQAGIASPEPIGADNSAQAAPMSAQPPQSSLPTQSLSQATSFPAQTTAHPTQPTSFPSAPPAPGSKNSGSGDEPKPGFHFSPKLAVGVIVFILMLVGGVAGLSLTKQNQDLRQQASTGGNCCSDQGWVGMGRSCGDPGAPSFTDGWSACQARQCGACAEEEKKQCDSPCDQVANQNKCVSVGENDNRWCGNDCYMRSKEESKAAPYNCTVAGDIGQPPTPPDTSGLDPNVPRTAAQICSAKSGAASSNNSADPNCSAQGGASCDIGGGNFCCYGDTRNSSNVVQRDGNCYNSARTCEGPYTIHKYSCSGATGFCSTQVATYQSDSKPNAEACTQFEIVDKNGLGCGGVAPSGGTAGCGGGTGGTNPPPPTTQKIPVGYQGTSTCEAATGWACDPDKFDANVEIHFYTGTATEAQTYVGSTTAKEQAYSETDRTQIAAQCGGNGNRRFSFVIPENVKSQTDKYLYAMAINIDADGNKTHVSPAGINTQNQLLTEGPKQIVSCEQPPPQAVTPTASFATTCKDNISTTGLRYTIDISNIAGTAPFNFSDVFLSFPPSKDNARIKAFLGASSYGDVGGNWYGYRIYKTGASHDLQTFTSWKSGSLSMIWDKSYTIGRNGKTIEDLAVQMTAWQNDASIPVADREALKNYKFSLAGNLSMGGVFNNTVGSSAVEISKTACTTPPVVGPMCMYIKAVNPTTNANFTATQLGTLKKGDALKFQCGATLADSNPGLTYQFQVLDSNKSVLKTLSATGVFSEPYTVATAGSFHAQCRICTPAVGGAGEPVCQEWYYPSVPVTQN